ncbi:hypothetical protein DIPPA_19626 [Diplonema papillatum]|nr:hypothetical protein DIPPA_19626 [Diplonema papillatum]
MTSALVRRANAAATVQDFLAEVFSNAGKGGYYWEDAAATAAGGDSGVGDESAFLQSEIDALLATCVSMRRWRGTDTEAASVVLEASHHNNSFVRQPRQPVDPFKQYYNRNSYYQKAASPSSQATRTETRVRALVKSRLLQAASSKDEWASFGRHCARQKRDRQREARTKAVDGRDIVSCNKSSAAARTDAFVRSRIAEERLARRSRQEHTHGRRVLETLYATPGLCNRANTAISVLGNAHRTSLWRACCAAAAAAQGFLRSLPAEKLRGSPRLRALIRKTATARAALKAVATSGPWQPPPAFAAYAVIARWLVRARRTVCGIRVRKTLLHFPSLRFGRAIHKFLARIRAAQGIVAAYQRSTAALLELWDRHFLRVEPKLHLAQIEGPFNRGRPKSSQLPARTKTRKEQRQEQLDNVMRSMLLSAALAKAEQGIPQQTRRSALMHALRNVRRAYIDEELTPYLVAKRHYNKARKKYFTATGTYRGFVLQKPELARMARLLSERAMHGIVKGLVDCAEDARNRAVLLNVETQRIADTYRSSHSRERPRLAAAKAGGAGACLIPLSPFESARMAAAARENPSLPRGASASLLASPLPPKEPPTNPRPSASKSRKCPARHARHAYSSSQLSLVIPS